MSHFTAMLKISPERLSRHGGDVDATVAEMLEPYQENNMGDCPEKYLEFIEDEESDVDEKTGKRGYWKNPNRKWDWYVIGGRWSGFFPVKDGVEPVVGRPGTFGNTPEPGRADVCRFSDLDMPRIATETRRLAEEFWEQWQQFCAGKRFRSFDGPRERALDIGLIEVKRDGITEAERPRAKRWGDEFPHLKGDARADWHDVWREIDRAAFMREYLDCFSPIITYAALDDGGWHASGEMGWFGCSSDKPADKVSFQKDFVGKFIQDSHPDTTFVVVDCHI